MLSIQHVLSAYIAKDGDKEWMDRHMAGLLFPDVIRAYSGPRGYSHFEKAQMELMSPIGKCHLT